MTRRVYLDHNASTPVHPEVVAAMLPYFSEIYGNPSSVHGFGRDARSAVDAARERVAGFLRVRADELVFTSGGTESDNFGLKGLALARGRGHVITSTIEHHAVLRSAQALEAQGFAVTYLPVDQYGMVDPDAVQTFGKVDIDVDAMGIDALSFSSHKVYGPKGIAGLYIRRGTKMVSIQHGGEHERRRRAGTENVPGIVGLGAAVEVRARDMKAEAERVSALRDRMWEGIRARVPDVRLNGHPTERLPGTANLSYRNVESESIVLGLDLKGIAVSAGSACTAGSVEPSHVLVAMGVPLDWAMGAVRSSLGRSTTADDVDYVVASVAEVVAKVRKAMPVPAA